MLCPFRNDEDLVAARRQLEAAGAFIVDALRCYARLGRAAQGGCRSGLDAGHVTHVDEKLVAVATVAAHEVQDGTGLFRSGSSPVAMCRLLALRRKESWFRGRFSNLGMVAPVMRCFVGDNMS